jgi:hypothetical protein
LRSRLTWFVCVVFLFATACSTSTAPSASATPAPSVSPADLVASLADVANGRNPDMAETGLVLKQIELKLLVGRERTVDARASILVLDAQASRRSEVSFTETFTLELPPPERRRTATAAATIPGVVEFVEAAMASARELARVAGREGLPQKLREVELVAKIVRSERFGGGLGFTFLTGTSVSGGVGRSADETNTVRLVFVPR